MKKSLLPLLAIALLIIGCKKNNEPFVMQDINEETLPVSFTKRVLLEDYSKHCQFCLPINSTLDSMRYAYPDNKFIPILISANHPDQLPYFDSIKSIFNITSSPTGSVNRVPAMNSGSQTGKLVYNKEHWASNVDAELLKTTDYGIKIKSTLKQDYLDFEISIGSFKTNSELKLSVFIIEDDTYYRTVKRVMNNFRGVPVDLKENEIRKLFHYAVNLGGYNIPKTSVIAFLHYFDESTQNFEIVNVQEVKAGESVDW